MRNQGFGNRFGFLEHVIIVAVTIGLLFFIAGTFLAEVFPGFKLFLERQFLGYTYNGRAFLFMYFFVVVIVVFALRKFNKFNALRKTEIFNALPVMHNIIHEVNRKCLHETTVFEFSDNFLATLNSKNELNYTYYKDLGLSEEELYMIEHNLSVFVGWIFVNMKNNQEFELKEQIRILKKGSSY